MSSLDEPSVAVLEDYALLRRVPFDVAAQRIVFRRLLPRVRAIAYSVLRSSDDAEDCIQEALLQILKSCEGYRGTSRLESWADSIAIRTAMRMARERTKRSQRLVQEDLHPSEEPSAPPGVQSEPWLLSKLPGYLEEVPDERRLVLVMRHVLGYSLPEISAITGTSENTIKHRLMRARETLRALLTRSVEVTGDLGRKSG
jgi:RNA polymerase sigma-70 factor, ECF subfamily